MILGIYSSQPQSGKSTVCGEFINVGFEKLSFATPVKESLAVVLRSLNVYKYEEYLYGKWKAKVIPELGVTGGYLMSHYATNFMRNSINEDVWLDAVRNQIVPNRDYVIDDLRFPNEFELFDYTIIVTRKDVSNHDRSAKSEGLLDHFPFDYIINNNASIEELLISARETVDYVNFLHETSK